MKNIIWYGPVVKVFAFRHLMTELIPKMKHLFDVFQLYPEAQTNKKIYKEVYACTRVVIFQTHAMYRKYRPMTICLV